MSTLIIPIETKVREFHGKMFFAYMAVSQGFEVIIGDQIRMRDYADLFPRGIWIDKSVATTRTAWFKKLKSIGHRVMSWDEEGLIFFNPDLYKNLRLDDETLMLTDHFFCWGNYHKDVILSFLPHVENKIHVCGNPRFDLMRKDYRKIYSESAAELKKKYGKILLINTNFSFHNHFRSQNELRKMLAAYPISSDKGYMDGWIEYQKQGFLTFQQIIPLMSQKYPDHTLIIRPHPSENHQAYECICEKCPNVIINAEGNVHEWIMASEVMLHDNCTTAVEAFILGVLPVSYRQVRNKIYENFLPDALSYNVSTEEQLLVALDNALVRNKSTYEAVWCKENYDTLSSYIAGLEGKTSVQSILELIESNGAGGIASPTLLTRLEWQLKIFWRKYLHAYREYRNPSDGYALQKFPGLNRDEIEHIFDKFDEILNRNTVFSIKQVTASIFRIQMLK